MVCIYAIANVKSGCTDAFLKTAESLIHHSRAEAGNIYYHLAKEIENRYVFMEIWSGEKAVEEHMRSSHFEEAGRKFAYLLEGSLDIHKLEGIL